MTGMVDRFHKLGLCSLTLVALLAANPARGEGVRAGTLIDNTATATYSDATGTKTVDSNTVTVKVDELLDVAIAWQDGAPVPIGSGAATLTFRVTNTGNGPEAYDLAVDPAISGNPFDTVVQSIAIDTNGNGVYDSGVDDILGAGDSTRAIDPDASLTVFVIVSDDGSASDGETSEIGLTATAVTGTGAAGTVFAGEGFDDTDAVVGSTTASATTNGSVIASVAGLELVKSAIVADPFGGTETVPGARVTYTLVATVTGSGSISQLRITDAIPAGTTYAAGTMTLDAAGLTDADDSDAGKADATGIDVLIGNVTSGTAHTITFDVTID